MRRFLYMSAQLRKTNAPLDLEVIVKQKKNVHWGDTGIYMYVGSSPGLENLMYMQYR